MMWYEYLVIALAVGFVGWVIARAVIRRKKGIRGCDCCEGGCVDCSHCALAKKK